MVTSMTLGRRKRFDTPVGVFTYEPLHERLFALSVRRLELSPTLPYLIASPEKAIVDGIWRRKDLGTVVPLERYPLDDLPMDLDHKNMFALTQVRELVRISAVFCPMTRAKAQPQGIHAQRALEQQNRRQRPPSSILSPRETAACQGV